MTYTAPIFPVTAPVISPVRSSHFISFLKWLAKWLRESVTSSANLYVQLHLPYTCCISLDASRWKLFIDVSVLTTVQLVPRELGAVQLVLASPTILLSVFLCSHRDFSEFLRVRQNRTEKSRNEMRCLLRAVYVIWRLNPIRGYLHRVAYSTRVHAGISTTSMNLVWMV